jgi:phosphate uptake regulator
MRRKIVQHGPSTLTISLPSEWAKQHSLRKGDDLTVESTREGLLIRTTKPRQHSPKSLSVKGANGVVTRAIAALYKAGYDEITVEYDGVQELEAIYRVLNSSYIGFEIIDEKPRELVIRKVSEPMPDEFPAIFRRIFHFLVATAEDGLKAAAAADRDEFTKLAMRDKNINKLTNYCRRAINKGAQQVYQCDTAIYHVVEQLEKVGDSYRDLHLLLHVQRTKPSKPLLALYERVNALLREYERLFFGFSIERMSEFYDRCCATSTAGIPAHDAAAALLLLNVANDLRNLSGVTMIIHL